MELQFQKTTIPCLHTLLRELQTQELTQEVRVVDGMPDIGRVLAGWSQIIIRGKDWRSSGVSVSGGVMVWVLYDPEDASGPQFMESWIPFQMKWDIPDTGRDGTICVMPQVCAMDVRSLSARKLMFRVEVCIKAEASVPSDLELYTPAELPQDVQILSHNYPVQLPRETGEKAFNLEETILLPASMPSVEKLIRYSLQPQLTEKKVMADKVVFRGIGKLSMLYKGADGQLHSHTAELPFSQYAELDREYDSTAVADIHFALTTLELEQGAEENLALRAGMIGQYTIYERSDLSVVEDAYSPIRTVKPQVIPLIVPSVLENRMEQLNPETVVSTDIVNPVDTVFYPQWPKVYTEGNEIHADMSGSFQLLGYDGTGSLQSAGTKWNEDWSMAADMDTRAEISVLPGSVEKAVADGTQAQLRTELPIQINTMNTQPIPMVTGVELGEEKPLAPSRPSLILQKAGDESLWNIAKKAGSTVEAIKQANHLEQEPLSQQVLLIPVL